MKDLRFYLTTRYASDDMPMLPDKCQRCGGGIVIRYDTPAGNAGGECDKDCGWTFQRAAIDRRPE